MQLRSSLLRTTAARRIALQLLMNLTARALRQPPLRIWTLPTDKALQRYADYTFAHLKDGADEQLLRRMGDEARRMGQRLRRWLMLRRQDDIEQVVTTLYQGIGIALEGNLPGRLCFRRCYFSGRYTPKVCQAASALDEGIMQGLTGGGKLTFQQRITEGHQHCLATYQKT